LAAADIVATANATNTVITFTQGLAQVAGATMALTAHSQIQDTTATTGTAVVVQGAALAIGAAGTLGTMTVSNASDNLTGGTLQITGADGTQTAVTLGTAGSTDTLANLAKTINASGAMHTTGLLTATVNSAGTVMTIAAGAGGAAVPMLYGTGVTTSLSLTGTPTAGTTPNSTIMGQLGEPAAGASTDTLAGTLTIGTETITLGTAATNTTPGTATMTQLAQTINAGNYGITATLNAAGTGMTFSSPNSANFNTTPVVSAATDSTTTGNLTWSTNNQSVTSSGYYSIGISGSVADTSTGANTTTALTKGLSNDMNGSGGVATMSYSDGAGQSLAATDLLNQANAQATLTALNVAISDVAAQDGYIGAQINTLNSVSSMLSTQSENVTSAQDAVQATDYASATSNMSKYEILSQTGISALAQANSMQQEVTKLLQ
jgi:flagellin